MKDLLLVEKSHDIVDRGHEQYDHHRNEGRSGREEDSVFPNIDPHEEKTEVVKQIIVSRRFPENVRKDPNGHLGAEVSGRILGRHAGNSKHKREEKRWDITHEGKEPDEYLVREQRPVPGKVPEIRQFYEKKQDLDRLHEIKHLSVHIRAGHGADTQPETSRSNVQRNDPKRDVKGHPLEFNKEPDAGQGGTQGYVLGHVDHESQQEHGGDQTVRKIIDKVDQEEDQAVDREAEQDDLDLEFQIEACQQEDRQEEVFGLAEKQAVENWGDHVDLARYDVVRSLFYFEDVAVVMQGIQRGEGWVGGLIWRFREARSIREGDPALRADLLAVKR